MILRKLRITQVALILGLADIMHKYSKTLSLKGVRLAIKLGKIPDSRCAAIILHGKESYRCNQYDGHQGDHTIDAP